MNNEIITFTTNEPTDSIPFFIFKQGNSTSADFFEHMKNDPSVSDDANNESVRQRFNDISSKDVALTIADNPEAATQFNSGQNGQLSKQGGHTLTQRRNALFPWGNHKHKINPVVDYGPMRGFGNSEPTILGTTVPKLNKNADPTQEDIEQYYKAIMSTIFLTATNDKKVLSLPILGAGIYHWKPEVAAAIILKATKDAKTYLGPKMPMVTLHDFNDLAKLTKEQVDGTSEQLSNQFNTIQVPSIIAETCHTIKHQYEANPYWQGFEINLPKLANDDETPSLRFEPTYISAKDHHPKRWDGYVSKNSNAVEQLQETCQNLLGDYSNRFKNFFLHPNRHHTNQARELIRTIRKAGSVESIAYLLKFELMKTLKDTSSNKVGSYCRRLRFLLDKANQALTKDEHKKAIHLSDLEMKRADNYTESLRRDTESEESKTPSR